VVSNMILNYYLLRLFIQVLHLYPTPAKMITTGLLIGFSYLSQKHYTFKTSTDKNI